MKYFAWEDQREKESYIFHNIARWKIKHYVEYCKFNRRLNGFNCKVDYSDMHEVTVSRLKTVVIYCNSIRLVCNWRPHSTLKCPFNTFHTCQVQSKQVSVEQQTHVACYFAISSGCRSYSSVSRIHHWAVTQRCSR